MVEYIDPKTGEYLWRCPQCKEDVRFSSLSTLHMSAKAGGCQGCLAKATFQRSPGMVHLFTDFWIRKGHWPESSSWLVSAGYPAAVEGSLARGRHIQRPQSEPARLH
jgi:hypothetical protein